MTKKKSASATSSRSLITVSGSTAVIAADDGGGVTGGGTGTNIKMKKSIRKNNRKEKQPPPVDCCALRPPYNLMVRPPSRKFSAGNNDDDDDDDDDCDDTEDINTVDDIFENVCNLLKFRRNIIVLVGAGISTSLGIPDFRSKDIGLYNTLKNDSNNELGLGLDCPEDLFCIDFFQDNPKPFYKFAKQLYYPSSPVSVKDDDVQKEDDYGVSTTAVITKNKRKKTKIETRTNATNNTRKRKLRKKEEKEEERTTNKIGNKIQTQTQTQIEETTKTKTVVSDSHNFLALLEKKKMLLRVYTQNIDGYESVAGVSDSKIVYCHGSLKQVKCLRCNNSFNTTPPPITPGSTTGPKDLSSGEDKNDDNRKNFMSSIQTGSVPYCKEPSKQNSQKKKEKKNGISTTSNIAYPFPSPSRISSRNRRKRSRSVLGIDNDNDEYHQQQEQHDNTNYCNGILKPSITFFGENLSNHVNKRIEYDRQKVDALIVIGTSLSVAPISKVIDYLPTNIPRIVINKTPIIKVPKKQKQNHDDDSNDNDNDVDFRKDYVFDSYLLGYCDDIARALGQQLGLGYDTATNNNNKSNSNKSNSNNISNGKKKYRAATSIPPPPSINSNSNSNRYAASDASARLLTTVLRDARTHKKTSEGEQSDDDDGSNINIGTIPPERIILFPGADIMSASSLSSATTTNNSKKDRTNNRDDDDHDKDQEQEQEETTTTTYEEIANCDGCSQIMNTHGVINGNDNRTIYKCSICFDYDLCSTCYPKQSKIHYNGQHEFYIE